VNHGHVDPSIAGEFPELRLFWTVADAGWARAPEGIRHRLRDMSERFNGPKAVALRAQPIPHAYRVFFRHIGLDPDTHRIPVEHVAVERLKAGAFKSRSLIDDALVIATMETSIGVWALDADALDGELTIRPAAEGELLGRHAQYPTYLPEGRLVVADDLGPVAVLFGDLAEGHGVSRATARVALFAVQVAGVPTIHIEEAFWIAEQILEEGADA
jgi:DNA/RNA-binding domain of Phe-tRNA-synthetase-like protein